ncbi:MAG TPA: LPS assembly lipoprotein LptE [Phnomibacter sp.]|nr:LPS assembly lipoprotein LptE [Phnomibacter sp.]
MKQGKIGPFSFSAPLILMVITLLTACGVYTMRDISIPPEVKTIKINFIENKATYVNPQLSPRVTDRLQQKVVSQTRLVRTNNDDADWVVSGYISEYRVTTSGISGQQASTNRLSVGVKLTLKDNVNNKSNNIDVMQNFEFPATQTLQQAETAKAEEIIRGITEEIFNRLFSNW